MIPGSLSTYSESIIPNCICLSLWRDRVLTKLSGLKFYTNLIFPFCLLLFFYSGFARPTFNSALFQNETDLRSSVDDIVNNPLKPPETASPQETLNSFISNLSLSYHIIQAANEQNKKLPGLWINKAVKNNVAEAELLFERAVYCLDLSGFPVAMQQDIGYDGALMLKEILDRIELPAFDSIPNEAAVNKDLEMRKYPQLLSWKIPNTDIILLKKKKGTKEGQYLFSEETVYQISEFYNTIKGLPYKNRAGVTPGFYQFYIETPSLLMPPKWSIYLPDWSKEIFFSLTIWQWIAFFLATLFLGITRWVLFLVLIKRRHISSALAKHWGQVLLYALTIGLISIY